MICNNCGGNHHRQDAKCPYCGTINEFQEAKNISPTSENTLILQPHILRMTYIILSLVMVLLISSTYYFYHYDDFYRHRQVNGMNRIQNLQLINSYLDHKEYTRALSVAYNTDPTYSQFENYSEVSEELRMIYVYTSFLYDIQSYMVSEGNLNYIDCSPYPFRMIKEIYNTVPTSERSQLLKEELEMSLDLYLLYYFQLTNEELTDLKECTSIDDFQIEGSTYFEGTLKERIIHYEKSH